MLHRLHSELQLNLVIMTKPMQQKLFTKPISTLKSKTGTYIQVGAKSKPIFCHNFIRYWPIYKIVSLVYSTVILQKRSDH